MNDLRSFNPSTLTWVDISIVANGARPEPRMLHGFASAGNKLYVHGGSGANGWPLYPFHELIYTPWPVYHTPIKPRHPNFLFQSFTLPFIPHLLYLLCITELNSKMMLIGRE